jgi:hypothetical protein
MASATDHWSNEKTGPIMGTLLRFAVEFDGAGAGRRAALPRRALVAARTARVVFAAWGFDAGSPTAARVGVSERGGPFAAAGRRGSSASAGIAAEVTWSVGEGAGHTASIELGASECRVAVLTIDPLGRMVLVAKPTAPHAATTGTAT